VRGELDSLWEKRKEGGTPLTTTLWGYVGSRHSRIDAANTGKVQCSRVLPSLSLSWYSSVVNIRKGTVQC